MPTIDVVVTASVLVRHTDARGALEDSVAKIRRTFKVNFKIVASHPDQRGDLIAKVVRHLAEKRDLFFSPPNIVEKRNARCTGRRIHVGRGCNRRIRNET